MDRRRSIPTRLSPATRPGHPRHGLSTVPTVTKNRAFESLWAAPEFRRIMGPEGAVGTLGGGDFTCRLAVDHDAPPADCCGSRCILELTHLVVVDDRSGGDVPELDAEAIRATSATGERAVDR